MKEEEEEDKIWSRVPKGGPKPRLTGRLTVGRKKNSNSTILTSYMNMEAAHSFEMFTKPDTPC
jgi:hypothetical protein